MHKRLKEKEPGQKKQVPFLHKKDKFQGKILRSAFWRNFLHFLVQNV